MELISRQSTKRPQADYVSILTYVLLCVFVKICLVRMCVCVCVYALPLLSGYLCQPAKRGDTMAILLAAVPACKPSCFGGLTSSAWFTVP